ncbi:hypothetical protein B0J13DRAFT_569057 [Dactylonectria estremocensis]|uniref:Secreted protein n=1 Tax=Dactylonectria estremocensis TaxID=1079267 RepID=A0A9P9DI70_9HYPO|nr:hypothetical protein B0J13DRAFT_568881 [Dactylonectria estremocensis]KAH7119452.1 hypothetical protein B0J13DRAFT_569057 [Dactylonectria estremocensis]
MTILSIKTAFLAGLTCLDTGLVSRDPMVVIATVAWMVKSSSVTALSEAVTETASQPSTLNTRSAAAGSNAFATFRGV